MFRYVLTAFNPLMWIVICRDVMMGYEFTRADLLATRKREDDYEIIIRNLIKEKVLLQAELRRLRGVDNSKLN